MTPPVGLVLGSALAPETLPGLSRLAEQLGYGELWFAEDYFFTGGISGAAAALAATERIPIGLGVVSAMVRHPALLAMEIATLDRMFPGRLRPGIGTGVPAWMRQMGVKPRSPLSALRESRDVGAAAARRRGGQPRGPLLPASTASSSRTRRRTACRSTWACSRRR